MNWTIEENREIEKYFNTNISEMTLYQRLFKLNPKRTFKSISRRLEDMRSKGFSKNKENAFKKLRVGYLDIEATNLNADFGFILTWYIKEKGKNYYDYGIIKREHILKYEFDYHVVHSLLVAMSKYDIIYAHYGSDRRFDLPYIRTRAFKNKLEHLLPTTNTLFIMDTYPIARNKLKLHSNRLGCIAEALNITNVKKTPLSSDKWIRASLGDEDALEYIALHNKRDVQLLEKVHKKLELIEKKIYRSI